MKNTYWSALAHRISIIKTDMTPLNWAHSLCTVMTEFLTWYTRATGAPARFCWMMGFCVVDCITFNIFTHGFIVYMIFMYIVWTQMLHQFVSLTQLTSRFFDLLWPVLLKQYVNIDFSYGFTIGLQLTFIFIIDYSSYILLINRLVYKRSENRGTCLV